VVVQPLLDSRRSRRLLTHTTPSIALVALNSNESNPIDLVVVLVTATLEREVPEFAVVPGRRTANSITGGMITVLAARPPIVGAESVTLGKTKVLDAVGGLQYCTALQ